MRNLLVLLLLTAVSLATLSDSGSMLESSRLCDPQDGSDMPFDDIFPKERGGVRLFANDDPQDGGDIPFAC